MRLDDGVEGPGDVAGVGHVPGPGGRLLDSCVTCHHLLYTFVTPLLSEYH